MANREALDYSSAHTSMPRNRRRKLRWPRIVLIAASGSAIAVVVAMAVSLLWLRSAARAALPVVDGDLRITGLSAPVIVRRDAHGVPHIEAATQDDLFVAQGYVTAQDRLWQMDTYRRSANGELAEVLGSRLIRHDTVERVMGFNKTAERIFENLGADDRGRFDDYARGVNLYIQQHLDSLPEE